MGGEHGPALVYGFILGEFAPEILDLPDCVEFVGAHYSPGSAVFASIVISRKDNDFNRILGEFELLRNDPRIKIIDEFAASKGHSCKWMLSLVGELEIY